MNMKQKIEEWLDSAPEGLEIFTPEIERIEEPLMSMGERMPMLISKGYEMTIRATMQKYSEK